MARLGSIERLLGLVAKGDYVKATAKRTEDTVFSHWFSEVLEVLEELYGADSVEYLSIDGIDFGWWDEEGEEARGLKFAPALQLMLQRLEVLSEETATKLRLGKYPVVRGSDASQSPGESSWLKRTIIGSIITIVVLVIAGIVTGVFQDWWSGKNASVGLLEERWKVTEVEFYHWYKYLRTEYQRGSDTVLQNVMQETRGRQPGISAQRQIAFAENFERQIEKTLDSFLAEYTIQGGDTSNLNYKKKPLGNLSSDLRNTLYKRR
jgi:hypothetical protein